MHVTYVALRYVTLLTSHEPLSHVTSDRVTLRGHDLTFRHIKLLRLEGGYGHF